MTDPTRPETRPELRRFVVSFIADLLNADGERIDTAAGLAHLGIDSATTLVLAADLSELLGEEISPLRLFDFTSVDLLLDALGEAA